MRCFIAPGHQSSSVGPQEVSKEDIDTVLDLFSNQAQIMVQCYGNIESFNGGKS